MTISPRKMAPEYTPADIMSRMRAHQNRVIRQQQRQERVHLWLARQHFYSAGEHHWRELGTLATLASKKNGLNSRPRRVDRWSPLFCGACAQCCGGQEEEDPESSPVPMLAASSVCESDFSVSEEGGELPSTLPPAGRTKPLITLRIEPAGGEGSAVDIVLDGDEEVKVREWVLV